MWRFYDRLAGSRDLATLHRRRPMEQSRRRGGRNRLSPINRSPASARGTHETEPCWSGLCGRPRNEAREVILCPAVSRRMQDLITSAMSGRPNELLRRRRLAPRPRAGWAEHPVQCRLTSFTDTRNPCPPRLRLAVVYAEQPPAASSTNADDACAARPSGVGLGRRFGTVASARARFCRPEERHAERAGAADASTLPPSSRRKIKLYTTSVLLKIANASHRAHSSS